MTDSPSGIILANLRLELSDAVTCLDAEPVQIERARQSARQAETALTALERHLSEGGALPAAWQSADPTHAAARRLLVRLDENIEGAERLDFVDLASLARTLAYLVLGETADKPDSVKWPSLPDPLDVEELREHLRSHHDTDVKGGNDDELDAIHAEYHQNAETHGWNSWNAHSHHDSDPAPVATCKHCGRSIIREGGAWVDPNATGDDAVWREACDEHDTITAEHEPDVPEYIWRDPHSDGWIDAWNGWYETLEQALDEAAAGVGTPWILPPGHGLISEGDTFWPSPEERRRKIEEHRKPEPNWLYPLFATCADCGQRLQFDIDPGGTPGQNGDWGANGDYGCDENEESDEEGVGGHTPIDIEWKPEEL
jgi:hypothetical protein